MVKLHMSYPEESHEQQLVREVTRSARADMLDSTPLRTLLQARDLQAMQKNRQHYCCR